MKLISLYAFAQSILSNHGKYNMLTGSEYIGNYIQKYHANSNTIFTYPGGANLHLLDKLSKNKHFNLIFNRHEQFVGHSAEGYAKSSDKIGIAITTSGPGITNMITPLQDALSDSVPMLCISAQVSSKVLGTNAFQEVDAIGLTNSCTKWNYLVDKIEKLPNALDLAFYYALNNKKGPVHLDICSDVLSDNIDDKDVIIKVDKFITNIVKKEARIGTNNNYLTVNLNDNLPKKSLNTLNRNSETPFNIKFKTSMPANLMSRRKFGACEMEFNLQIRPFLHDINLKSICIDNTFTFNLLYNKNFDNLDSYSKPLKTGNYKKIKNYDIDMIDGKIQGKVMQDYMIFKSTDKKNTGKVQKFNATEFELNVNLEPLNVLKPILMNPDSPDKINFKGSFFHNTIGVKTLKNITANPISNDKLKMSIPLQKYYQIQKVAVLLNNAKAPIIVVGKGAINAYKQIRSLSKNYSIPVTTTLHGLGIVDEEEDLSLKMLGMHGTGYANMAVQQADVIIGIGYRFDDRTIGNPLKYAPVAKSNNGIVHIDINSNSIETVKKTINPDISLEIDCLTFLDQLKPLIEIKAELERIHCIKRLKKDYPLNYKKSNNLKVPDVIKELSRQIRDNVIITTGVGNHQMMTAQHFTWKHPRTMISSGSLGTMGVGLSFAIGSKLANPNKTVICIDGDGSFMMSIQELATIREYKLPIKILIMNDNALQMVTTWQELFYDNNIVGTHLQNPRFKELGRSFGIKSISCDSKNNLNTIIKYILDYDGPILCEFKIEPDICTPFVKPGNALDDMIL